MALNGVTIISGGQRGVDTAALKVAHNLKLAYCGWVPKGYLNESGQVAIKYRHNLRETISSETQQRIELNVRDATHLLTLQRGIDYAGGTKFGIEISRKHGSKELKFVDLDKDWTLQVTEVQQWLNSDEDVKCSVGGPRESEQPGIEEDATHFLMQVFCSSS